VQEDRAKLALCTALFSANQVGKSGDHAGQTPFEIVIVLNTSKYYGYGDDYMCVCVCARAHVCMCMYFVAPQMEEAALRYGELALNIFDNQP